MIVEDDLEQRCVAFQALETVHHRLQGRRVGREEGEAVQTAVDDGQDGRVAGLARASVVVWDIDAIEGRLKRGERGVVRRNGVDERLWIAEYVANDINGEVPVGDHVRDDGFVPVG